MRSLSRPVLSIDFSRVFEAVAVLKAWSLKQPTIPYPSEGEKDDLAEATGARAPTNDGFASAAHSFVSSVRLGLEKKQINGPFLHLVLDSSTHP